MRRLSGAGPTAVIAFLVVLDIVLIGLAFRHGNSHGPNLSEPAVVSESTKNPHASTTADPTASTSTSPTPSSSSEPPVKTPARLVSTVDGQVATFANFGCHGKPAMQSTADGGNTTTAVTPPAPHLLRIVQTTATAIWVIGADGSCHPTYYSSADGGVTWTAAASLGQVWVALPKGVHTPKGKTSKPCGTSSPEPIALSPSGMADAMVVCSDGALKTTNGGKSWQPLTGLPKGQVVDVSLATGGTATALIAKSGSCKGLLAIATTSAGRSWSKGQCLSIKGAPGLSITDTGAGIAFGSGSTYSTSNGGASWTNG